MQPRSECATVVPDCGQQHGGNVDTDTGDLQQLRRSADDELGEQHLQLGHLVVEGEDSTAKRPQRGLVAYSTGSVPGRGRNPATSRAITARVACRNRSRNSSGAVNTKWRIWLSVAIR